MSTLPHTQRRPKEGEIITGWDVWRWPEFKAFADRLGVEFGPPTTCLTIRIHIDELPSVIHEYQGRDFEEALKTNGVDTTTVHNEQFRTKIPNSVPHPDKML